MDSVSQSAEDKKHGNNQSEKSEENGNSNAAVENSSTVQLLELEQNLQNQNQSADQTADSGKTPATMCSPSRSSPAPEDERPPPPPVDQSSCSTAAESSPRSEQVSQSEAEMQKSAPGPPDEKCPPVASVPELTPAGKFEISPTTKAAEIKISNEEGSFKLLECVRSRNGSDTGGVDNSTVQNKSQNENEKSGTTTFEVNRFRDAKLKIAAESLETLSSTSSQHCDGDDGEGAADADESKFSRKSSLLSSSSSSSSKIESTTMQQERKDTTVVESSSHTVKKSDSSKSIMQPDSCVKSEDSAASVLGNDFILDSKKLTGSPATSSLKHEAISTEKAHPSDNSNSSGEGNFGDKSKGIASSPRNYSSSRILNARKDSIGRHEGENILSRLQPEGAPNSNSSMKNNETASSENASSSSSSGNHNLATAPPNMPTVSSLMEQSEHQVSRGMGTIDKSAKFEADKDINSAVIRDRYSAAVAERSINLDDNVVSSSNNSSSFSEEHHNSVGREVNATKEMVLDSSKTEIQDLTKPLPNGSKAESSSGQATSCSSTSICRDGRENQSEMKTQSYTNFMQNQNTSSSFQSCQPTTKEIVASKIRYFYDKPNNYSVFGGSHQRSEVETCPKSTPYSDYSHYYINSSKQSESAVRHSQFQNPPTSSHIQNVNNSLISAESSNIEKTEQRQVDNSKVQSYNEKLSYNSSSTTPVLWRATENQYPKNRYDGKSKSEDIINLHSSTNSSSSKTSTVSSMHPVAMTPEQMHQQAAQVKACGAIRLNSNQVREFDTQGHGNLSQIEKESICNKKQISAISDKAQQRLESQLCGSNNMNQNQLHQVDYQKYLPMNPPEKEKEYQRQVIYNQKSVVESTDGMNRSLVVQKQSELAREQESFTDSNMGLMNRPSPVQSYMDSSMRPSPYQSHSDAMRRPSPVQNHADAMRRPSPIQTHGEAIRRPSPIQQNHMEAIRRPSPVQNHTEVLRPSPVQMIQNVQNHSLYVNNPDFSKQMQPKQRTNTNSNNDLSQLHMKPPDFSKVSPAQRQQQQQLRQNPPQQINKPKDCYKQNVPPQITQQNFAEISKKYNYISDLQLKNPPTSEERNTTSQDKRPYNNLYVKAPDFSTDKFHSKSSSESNYEIQHQYHSTQPQQTATMGPKSYNAIPSNDSSYARQFPQLSHDIELSVVSQKNNSFQSEKTPNACEFQAQGKHIPFPQEQAAKLQDRSARNSTLNEQRGVQGQYSSRINPSDYPTAYTNSAHHQSREQYQQSHPAKSTYLPDSKSTVRPNEITVQPQTIYETARYEPKIQQNTFAQSYPRDSYSNPNYSYPQSSPSVIQSSKSKDCYPEYPPPSNLIKTGSEYSIMSTGNRSMATSNYYNSGQQATPPTTPSSINSIPSPSQVGTSKSYSNQMPQQNLSNPPSPACHQQQGPYKTTPSPGAMNPPYGWPSQSTTRGAMQMGTSSSPHSYRVSQSPLGANAPSPHSQSPSYMQPSPKASPSPTYPMTRPSPQGPNVHMSYKPPYVPSAQSIPAYYQQIDHSKQVTNPNYPIKIDKANQELPVNQYKSPTEIKQDLDQYRQTESRKDFLPNDYSTTQYIQKSAISKRVEYPEYQQQIPRKNEALKNSYKYSLPTAETMGRTEFQSALGKSSSELSLNKSNQKPNYREMINQAYAKRNSISEKELNAEIIKRTLKKDIMRRSDSDLSKNIFDSPDPTKNCGYFARSTECLRPQQPDVMPKYPQFDPGRRPSYPETSKSSRPYEYHERKPSLPLCSELARNDISVTVSKVVKPPAPEKTKTFERQGLHAGYPRSNEFSSVVISKVNPTLEHPTPLKSQRPKEMPKAQPSIAESSKPSGSSVFAPTKRESPLDLSVKTVKTKADSTGCDDVNSYLNRTKASTSSALKVDFAPNFSKHAIGDNAGTRVNAQPPSGCYEPRLANTAVSAQVSKACAQPAQLVKPNAVSQSISTSQHQTQAVNSSAALGTGHHSQTPHHHQYSSPHHYLPHQQHIQATTHNSTVPNYPSTRPENVYPLHQASSRDVSSYHYPQGQGVLPEQKINPHIVTPEQQQQQQYAASTHQQKQMYEQVKECQKARSNLYQPVLGTSTYSLSSKESNMHMYASAKRDSDSVKQSVILNPPMPSTVYDKKSDDYLVNTPQHQRKVTEKVKEPELPKAARSAEVPLHIQQQKYSNVHPTQVSNLRYGQPYGPISNRPEDKPILHNHMGQQHPSTVVQKEYLGPYPQYDRTKVDTKVRVQEEYLKNTEEPRPANVPARNMTYDPYSPYASTAPVVDPHKAPVDYKARVNNKANVALEQGDSMHDRLRPSEYHRKRPPEPVPGKGYQPPDKQVRVDELYRAHLEETYRQQQKQHQQNNSQSHGEHSYERRDMSVIQPTADINNKMESSFKSNCAPMQPLRPPGQYNYPYKEGYQVYGPPGRETHPSQVPLNYHQTQQIWYPQVQPREKALQETTEREAQSYHSQYDLESNRIHVEVKKPPTTSPEVGFKPTVSASVPPSLVNNNTTSVLRGADQNVISKLRNSIEMREYEKQRNSLLKKQINLNETGEDDASKPDIASILAARIRTKGELKGYTALPLNSLVKTKESENEPISEKKEVLLPIPDPFSEGEEEKRLDLLDWSSACNDFVEQLLTGNSKKRGKKKRGPKETANENSTEIKPDDIEKDKQPFPGKEYNCAMDKDIVEQIKTEVTKSAAAISVKKEQRTVRDSTSSDEDKPLLHLKQQKGSDASASAYIESELKQKSSQENVLGEIKSQDSESTMQSNRSSVMDKLNEKSARNLREKQRMEQERRLAARLSRTSSSDSEDDGKRSTPRQKRPRKPRSRTSGASNRELSETDSSGAEDKIMSRNLIRSRIESKKRRRVENSTSESDTTENEQKSGQKKMEEKTKSSTKKEMITKAKVKCMKLSSESSDSSDEEIQKPTTKKAVKDETTLKGKVASKDDGSEDESATDRGKLRSSSPCKPRNKRAVSTRQSIEESAVKETMTRSKRKKELEQQIANSKILRNEKIVQNIQPSKVKSSERVLCKAGKISENWSQEEKGKSALNKGKIDKSEELKRKHCENESDEKGRKKRFAKEELSSSSSDSSKDSEEETVSARVRTRRSRQSNEKFEPETGKLSKKFKIKDKIKDEIPKNSAAKPGLSKKSSGKNKPIEQAETNTEKFPPGWEQEVYQYKRALKVPASLITIKGPVHHRVSTSLPDLDPHSSDASESFSAENSRQGNFKSTLEDTKVHSQSKNSKKSFKIKKEEMDVEQDMSLKKDEQHKPKSIIDVLHSRVLKSKKLNKKNAKIAQGNEPKLLPRGSNEAELLPTPASVKDNKNPFVHEHHSLFETEVLKSRTRTEYRILKNKELIREVFGGEDRPASAPPEIRDNGLDAIEIKTEQVTFDQKYQQYLQKMNVDFGEKIRKNKKMLQPLGVTECGGVIIKTERIDEEEASLMLNNADEETQDMEINECFQTPLAIKEEVVDTPERDTPSVTSEREGVVTPLIFKRRKTGKNRSGRRKGSSGFDYIRKKKKVSSANANSSQDMFKKKRISPIELFHTRDENDVSKEIQKWVLNKSVGQSALHKAARLGYLDVIAYCLERMRMHPDPKDNAGYTPLHEACAKGRIDIARVLLQYGANHSETAHSGIRPLHEASENGHIEVVRLLLSYGADPLLTTYSGQTPLKLAESQEMETFLKNHLQDVQNTGPHKQPWKFPGPWKIYDEEEYGYNVLSEAPEANEECEEENTAKDDVYSQKGKEKCDTNSNIMVSEDKIKKPSPLDLETTASLKTKLKSVSKCTVVLDNIDSLDHINSVKQFNDCHGKLISRRRSTFEKKELRTGRVPEESDCDGEAFEFEESDMPLPPLYLLKDEGTEKWVLLNDLCNMLKVKSKDTLLKQICPSIPPSTVNKELLRELKMSDFLEKATCLQLLCAGEKLNISSSKVVLVKYNDSVRNLLGVKTILMKF